RFALANELTHARRLQRIVRNKLWPLESGVDVFIDNRGFAYRLAVVHQSRHDTVWIQGEVLGLHLIELEEVDIAAAPFDSFLFSLPAPFGIAPNIRSSKSGRAQPLSPSHALAGARAVCCACCGRTIPWQGPAPPKAPRNSRRLHAHP